MRDGGARITLPTLQELCGISGLGRPLFFSASSECLAISAACMGFQGPELFNSELHGLSARQHIVIPDLLTSQGYLPHKSDSFGASPTTYMTASWFSATVPLLHPGVAHVNSSDNVKLAASK